MTHAAGVWYAGKRLFSEREFAGQVEDLLNLGGWTWVHIWSMQHSAAGLTDYIGIRPPRIIWLEIKGYDARGRLGQPSAEQAEWMELLEACDAEWRLAQPEDLEALAEWLR